MSHDPITEPDPRTRLEAHRERLQDLQAMLGGVLGMSRDEMCESKSAVLRERLLCQAIDLLDEIAAEVRALADALPAQAEHSPGVRA